MESRVGAQRLLRELEAELAEAYQRAADPHLLAVCEQLLAACRVIVAGGRPDPGPLRELVAEPCHDPDVQAFALEALELLESVGERPS